MEDRIPTGRTGLERKGHEIKVQGAFSSMVGAARA